MRDKQENQLKGWKNNENKELSVTRIVQVHFLDKLKKVKITEIYYCYVIAKNYEYC